MALLAAGALAALAGGAPASFAPVFVPLARSTLVTVEATTDAGTLILRVARTRDEAPLTGAQLQVTLDGHSLPVKPRPDGTWEAPLGALASSPGALEVIVAHDGVREMLTGQLPGAPRRRGGCPRRHGQRREPAGAQAAGLVDPQYRGRADRRDRRLTPHVLITDR